MFNLLFIVTDIDVVDKLIDYIQFHAALDSPKEKVTPRPETKIWCYMAMKHYNEEVKVIKFNDIFFFI